MEVETVKPEIVPPPESLAAPIHWEYRVKILVGHNGNVSTTTKPLKDLGEVSRYLQSVCFGIGLRRGSKVVIERRPSLPWEEIKNVSVGDFSLKNAHGLLPGESTV